MIYLSILIPSVPSRIASGKAIELLNEITRQADEIGNEFVEVLFLFDNKQRTVGAKRNALLEMAQGEWVVFLDDDDRVHTQYITKVLLAISQCNERQDVIVYKIILNDLTNRREVECSYSLAVSQCRYISDKKYVGHPSHTMPWRAKVAKRVQFADKNFGEDTGWSSRVAKLCRSEFQIPEVLYWYDHNVATSETRHGL